MSKRHVRAQLHAHGPFRFAFLQTEQPLDIPGLAEFNRRAQALNSSNVGEIDAYVVEDLDKLDTQRAVIGAPQKVLSRAAFEKLVREMFPHDTMDVTWVRLSEVDEIFSAQARTLLLKYAAM